jgi:hypothetical protein
VGASFNAATDTAEIERWADRALTVADASELFVEL